MDTINYTQFLGVIMDNKINWNEHIKFTSKNIKEDAFLEI